MSDDLRHADLSGLALDQMNAAQRAEMKRRYEAFVRRLPRPEVKVKLPPPSDLQRWAPTQLRSSKR